MRGAHLLDSDMQLVERIIPADAGSTGTDLRAMGPDRDHPRRCGEHASGKIDTFEDGGSSPQMRGALDRMPCRIFVTRIIPADAGSTLSAKRLYLLTLDHPRRCGEHVGVAAVKAFMDGSSPQMREARTTLLCALRTAGIIPADAGSTAANELKLNDHKDHPRRCGEHYRYPWFPLSSPGIIPADAGSTRKVQDTQTVQENHPRRCGEHAGLWCCAHLPSGSSPQMRGAQNDFRQIFIRHRIIPADAGSTQADGRQNH